MLKLVSSEGPDSLSSPSDKYTCIFQISGNSVIHKVLRQEFQGMSTHSFNSTNIYWSPMIDQHLLCHKYRDRKHSPCPQKRNLGEPIGVHWIWLVTRTRKKIQTARTTGKCTAETLGPLGEGGRLRKTDPNTVGSMYHGNHGNDLSSFPRSYWYLMKESKLSNWFTLPVTSTVTHKNGHISKY